VLFLIRSGGLTVLYVDLMTDNLAAADNIANLIDPMPPVVTGSFEEAKCRHSL
jgi:hypothetical protein